MGLFDFLTQSPSGQPISFSGNPAETPMPVAQQPAVPPEMAQQPVPQMPQGGLLQPPAQTAHTPGLLDRLRSPDETGISMLDKIGAAAAMLRDNAEPDVGYKLLSQRQQAFAKAKDTAAAQALKEKGNQAFRAAYQGGKFDPAVYASVMGDDLDPMAFAKLNSAVGQEGGVEGGYAYTKSKLGGGVQWGSERPPTYADKNSQASLEERLRHDQVTERQGEGHLTVAQQNAALAAKREGRLASKPAGGGASWLPPGAKIIHLPGS